MITQPSTIISFARKLFSLENLSYLFLATPGSISLTSLLDALIEDTALKALMLPLVVTFVSLSLYFIIFFLDFISGVKASRYEAEDKENYFSSAKGWSSMWKLATVSVLVTWSSFFSMLAAIANFTWLSTFFMTSSGTIAIMASLLDIYSIGENQKRLTGKKAKIFEWFESLMNLINEGVMGRLKRGSKDLTGL